MPGQRTRRRSRTRNRRNKRRTQRGGFVCLPCLPAFPAVATAVGAGAATVGLISHKSSSEERVVNGKKSVKRKEVYKLNRDGKRMKKTLFFT